MNQRPILFVTLCLALGIVLGKVLIPDGLYPILGGSICSLCIYLWLRRELFLYLSFVAVGYVLITVQTPSPTAHQTLLTNASWHVDQATLYSQGQKLILSQNDERRLIYLRDTTDMYLSQDSLQLSRVTWQTPQFIRSPYQFDYNEYLQTKGVSQMAFVRPYQVRLTHRHRSFKNSLIRHIDTVNLSIYSKQLIGNLLLGSKRWNTPDRTFIQSLQQTGLIHIMAISGLHIGLLFLLIQYMLSRIIRRHTYQSILGLLSILPIWFFIDFVGYPISAVRAAIMASLFAIARWQGKPQSSFHILFLTAFILLLFDPNQLFSLGFQLSFCAVLGILVCYPFFFEYLSKPFPSWTKPIWQLMAVSLSAQLGVLPFMVLIFGQFPLAFLIANLTVVWLVPVFLVVSPFVLLLDRWGVSSLVQFFTLSIDGLIAYLQGLQSGLPLMNFGRWSNASQALFICYWALLGAGLYYRRKAVFAIWSLALLLWASSMALDRHNWSKQSEILWLSDQTELYRVSKKGTRATLTSTTTDSSSIRQVLDNRLSTWLQTTHVETLQLLPTDSSIWVYREGNTWHIYERDTSLSLLPNSFSRWATPSLQNE